MAVHHLSWLESGVIGGMQGVAELFPISSLGHSVLLPAVVGGSWSRDLNVATPESPYLAFIVGLHVATAIALHHLLLARLGAHHQRPREQHRDPKGTNVRPTTRLAARARHHPGGPRWSARRTLVPHHARQAQPDGGLPHRQRVPPARRRGAAAARQQRRHRLRRRADHRSGVRRAARAPARAARRRHRRQSDPRAGARHLTVRRRDGLRLGTRPVPRGCRPLLVPARHPGDPRRRRAQAR